MREPLHTLVEAVADGLAEVGVEVTGVVLATKVGVDDTWVVSVAEEAEVAVPGRLNYVDSSTENAIKRRTGSLPLRVPLVGICAHVTINTSGAA